MLSLGTKAKKMLENEDIICLSTTSWDGIWGSRQQIMSRLAKSNRVIFVEPPPEFRQLISGREYRKEALGSIAKWRRGVQLIRDKLYVYPLPLLFPLRSLHLSNLLSTKWIAVFLHRVMKELEVRSPIIWNYHPKSAELVEKLGEKLFIYHCIDEFSAGRFGPFFRKATIRQEEKLLQRSDIVFVWSKSAYEKKKKHNPNTFFVPSGVDAEHYLKATRETTPIPADMKQLSRPICAYIGGVSEQKVDFSLLETLACSLPRANFVLAGPLKLHHLDIDKITAKPNIHYLGQIAVDRLPNYLKAVDVCLLPYQINDHTRYIFPLKLFEYMATGKPIVTTDLPEVRDFTGLVRIARTRHEFLDHVRAALDEDDPKAQRARINMALDNTWEKRIERLSRLIYQHLRDEVK